MSNKPEETKKNITEILYDKAEKAGENAGEAVKHFTEMLTSKDNPSSVSKDGIIESDKIHLSDDNRSVSGTNWKVSLINILLVFYDLFAVTISYFFALWFRFDGNFSQIPRQYLSPYIIFIPFYAVFCIIVFSFLKLYKSLWRYASVLEAVRVVEATVITGVCHIIFITAFLKRMPLSYYFFGPIFQFFLILGVRYFYRFYLIVRRKYTRDVATQKRVMIIGAGEAGKNLIKEIHRSEEMHEIPICVIDDDQSKWNKQIEGVPVVGGRESILLNVEKNKIEKIYYAIPSSSKSSQRDVLTICAETKCELKTLPGIYQLANGEVDIKAVKDVAIEDLLGREPVKVNMEESRFQEGLFLSQEVVVQSEVK